jgi:hypothetical protein
MLDPWKIWVARLNSDISRRVDEIYALPGYYVAHGGNSLPMFRENLSAKSSTVNF